jgi:two-component system NtrC family sensor kinase
MHPDAVPDDSIPAEPAIEKFSMPMEKGFPLSIRSKGLLVFGVLALYAVLIFSFVWHQKEALLAEFEEMQRLSQAEGTLMELDSAVFLTAMEAVLINGSPHEGGMQRIHGHFRRVQEKRAELAVTIPKLDQGLSAAAAALAVADRDPTRLNLHLFMLELRKIKSEVANAVAHSRERQQAMATSYRAQSDSAMLTAIFLGLIGLAVLGVIASLFFARLSRDLSTLQTRSLDIVKGYRGVPLEISRHDEVGRMMAAVNHMATMLDTRDGELMIARQKYFHKEKMAAIGALAAGVAHEIGNPIAAISGIVQEMNDLHTSGACAHPKAACKPGMIQRQIQRLAMITREISEFASPRRAEPELLDLNGLVRSTGNLIHYDKRLRRVELQLDLDDQLPAIHGIADQLVQVIMNLLINAVDALEDVDNRVPTIIISTRVVDDRVCMAVEDNGHGMDVSTAARAFDAFFTTKSAGKGTGLGLPLCYSIAKEHGGAIEIESVPGKGTRVQVFLPMNETSA